MSQVSLAKQFDEKSEDIVLSVRGLSVDFKGRKGTVHALRNVSFDVFESDILSIVGESGSGKTTVARCIARLTRPTSGSIMHNNVDVSSLKGKSLFEYRKAVQMIFQDPFESLNPKQDVFTAISAPIQYLLGEKNQTVLYTAVTRLLEEVGLEPERVMYRYPHQISGGERQRVSIARALAPNPKVLIADEPITMLDSAQRLNVLSILRDLRTKRNLTIVMITHDLASAKLLSNKIIVLYRGNVIEACKTESILSSPHHPYTELILASMPDLNLPKTDVEVPSAEWGDVSVLPSKGCIFRPRCKYATSICTDVEPELSEKSPGHIAACHNALNIGKPK
ncbi:MAG: ABC transporter ATP-binding protein [Nitrososphaerales archaeon]